MVDRLPDPDAGRHTWAKAAGGDPQETAFVEGTPEGRRLTWSGRKGRSPKTDRVRNRNGGYGNYEQTITLEEWRARAERQARQPKPKPRVEDPWAAPPGMAWSRRERVLVRFDAKSQTWEWVERDEGRGERAWSGLTPAYRFVPVEIVGRDFSPTWELIAEEYADPPPELEIIDPRRRQQLMRPLCEQCHEKPARSAKGGLCDRCRKRKSRR